MNNKNIEVFKKNSIGITENSVGNQDSKKYGVGTYVPYSIREYIKLHQL
jgi:hypothetical protein